MDDTLLTVAQTARALAVGRTTTYRLIRNDGLPAIQVGGSTRVRESDLAAYIASRPSTRPTAPTSRKAR